MNVRRNQQDRSSFLLGSVFSFGTAALFWHFARRSAQKRDNIKNCVTITRENIDRLPEMIDESPQKRIYVKLAGRLVADEPLTTISPETQTSYQSIYTRFKQTSYSASARKSVLDDYMIHAPEIFVQIGDEESSPKMPRISLNPSCLHLLNPQMQQISRVQKINGSKFASSIFSIAFGHYSWSLVDTIHIVGQNKSVFVALDAVKDTNGSVSLIESRRAGYSNYLTSQHMQTVLDYHTDLETACKATTFISATLGTILAAIFIGSR